MTCAVISTGLYEFLCSIIAPVTSSILISVGSEDSNVIRSLRNGLKVSDDIRLGISLLSLSLRLSLET